MIRILTLVGLAILSLIAVFGSWYLSISREAPLSAAVATSGLSATSSPDTAAAAATVTGFGLSQQRVALTSPDASSTLANVYAPYVAPALLARWQADPQSAPGRVAEKQWPDHIEIGAIRRTTDGLEITGTLVMMTSDKLARGGAAGTDPVLIDLAKLDGAWLITNYEDQSGS